MMYACITVLRALALREGSAKVWKEYTKFESHLQDRMETPVYTKVSNYDLFIITLNLIRKVAKCIAINARTSRKCEAHLIDFIKGEPKTPIVILAFLTTGCYCWGWPGNCVK